MVTTQQDRQRAHGRSRLAALALGLLVAAGAAQAQERRGVAGTSVSLVAPKGFEAASGFAGLADKARQASVLIVEMPAEAYPQLAPLFGSAETAKAGFARQNVEIADIEQIDGDGGQKVPLLRGKQTAAGAKLDKWIALFKGPKTVMLTVQAPETARLDAAEIRAMVASVSLGREPTLQEKLGSLPFSIMPAAPFRVVDTIGGSGVLLTVGERNTDPSGAQPMMIAAYQISAPAAVEEAEALAEDLLKKTRDLQSAEIRERRRLPFAGGNGVLLSGRFTHAGGGAKSFAQYFAIGPDGRFVRLLAMADEAQFVELREAIETTAASIAFRAK